MANGIHLLGFDSPPVVEVTIIFTIIAEYVEECAFATEGCETENRSIYMDLGRPMRVALHKSQSGLQCLHKFPPLSERPPLQEDQMVGQSHSQKPCASNLPA